VNYVLIHGGGHGGWCYRWLANELRSAGHEVWTPTLTGFGDRSHLGGREVDFATFVTDVVQVLELEDVTDAVLVGHSMGGVVVPRVAEVAAGRISQVVWMAAVVLADGETLLEAVPQTPEMARAVRIRPDGTAETDADRIVEAVVNDGSPEQRRWVRERHRPYPPAALVEPGRLTAFLRLGLPTAYVTATRDAAIPREASQRFADRLPGCARAEVDAGHDLMVTQPGATARALESATAGS
jgi:pimeloyl-ACP methyl ester carboxylesterase